MNEYLLNLYNWISSKDSNFASRATPEKFVEKMENDASYNASIHKWISSKDGMFSQKSPLNVFQEKTLKKKRFTCRFFFSKGRYGACINGRWFIGISRKD